MSEIVPRLAKDREEIIVKFAALIKVASTLHDPTGGYTIEQLVQFREVRASALNLLARGPCTCRMRINPAHLAGEPNEASIVRF